MTTEELIHAILHEWPCPFEQNGYLRWGAPDGTVLPGKLRLDLRDYATAKANYEHHAAMEKLRSESSFPETLDKFLRVCYNGASQE